MPPIRRTDSAAVPQTQQSTSAAKPAGSGGSFSSRLQGAAANVTSVPATPTSAPTAAPAPAASAASPQQTGSTQSALQEIGKQQEDLAKSLREIMLQQGLMLGQQIRASGANAPKVDSE